MVLDPSLDLIAGWGDREIHRPVDEIDASSACADAGADCPLPLSAPPLRLAKRRP
jgi:hypothetical protein